MRTGVLEDIIELTYNKQITPRLEADNISTEIILDENNKLVDDDLEK